MDKEYKSRTLHPSDIDVNFSIYMKKWLDKRFTSSNLLPKFTPHVEIINIRDMDAGRGMILIGIKCSLKWVDYRYDETTINDDSPYPFEPRVIIKDVHQVESEFKTNSQVLHVIKLGVLTVYTMEKTYYWNLWMNLTNRISILDPFTKCISQFSLTLVKFPRTMNFVNHLKNKIGPHPISTSKDHYGEFGKYKSSYKIFKWTKVTHGISRELIPYLKLSQNEVQEEKTIILSLQEGLDVRVNRSHIENVFFVHIN